MKRRFILLITVLAATLIWQPSLQAQTFVDADATGNNDGTTWQNAYTTLHEALENYAAGDVIWVAAGTHHPSQPSAWTLGQKNTFYLNKDVKLYGGFAGTEAALDQRDTTNVTVLSGDLDDDDVPDDFTTNRSDNAVNIMFMDTLVSTATIIDGFTFVGGHADGDALVRSNERGAGIWTIGAPQIRNCRFTQNYTVLHGAGIYFNKGATEGASIQNCVFENNEAAQFGGGIFINASAGDGLTIVKNIFRNNRARAGGGINSIDTKVLIKDNVFTGNYGPLGDNYGGGLMLQVFAPEATDIATVINCTFVENKATHGGGMFFFGPREASTAVIIDSCEFLNNEASEARFQQDIAGAGLYVQFMDGHSGTTLSVSNSSFNANYSEEFGGALFVIYGNGADNTVSVRDCQFNRNIAEVYGGAIVTSSGNLGSHTTSLFEMDNCEVFNNISNGAGGGIAININGYVNRNLIRNTHFKGNEAPAYQSLAAASLTPGAVGRAEAINCLFTGHPAGPTAVVAGADSGIELLLTNATFADNASPSLGVDFVAPGGQILLNNSILASTGSSNFLSPTGSPLGSVISQGGNLVNDATLNQVLNETDQSDADPLFHTSTYELSLQSPAIDAGIASDDVVATDFAGNNRIEGGCIDIGAFESMFNAGTDCQMLTGLLDRPANHIYLTIAPNPAVDRIAVSFENDWRGKVQYRIINPLGQTLRTGTLVKFADSMNATIAIDGLPAGQYYLYMSNNTGSAAQEFIKR